MYSRLLIRLVACSIMFSGVAHVSQAVSPVPSSIGSVAPLRRAESSPSREGRRLYFEANKGQAEKQARFLAEGHGYRLAFTRQGAALEPVHPLSEVGTSPTPLRLRLLGANPRPGMRGLWKSKDRAVVTQGAGNGLKNVPTFRKVLYEGVYPGINLVFYGNPAQLEYDFILNPHADPDKIRLAFEGAERVEAEGDGDLLLTTPSGVFRQKRPVIYQVIGGERREVSGGYLLESGGEVRFRVGAYDPAHPLIIDPVLVYCPRPS